MREFCERDSRSMRGRSVQRGDGIGGVRAARVRQRASALLMGHIGDAARRLYLIPMTSGYTYECFTSTGLVAKLERD